MYVCMYVFCRLLVKYWLCRASKIAEQASEAFISKGNSTAARHWFVEVEFFGFDLETEDSHRQYRLEPGAVCVPCNAFVYERGLEFVRTAAAVDGEPELFYLSADMHKQICDNDELQLDSDLEAEQEEQEEEEKDAEQQEEGN